MSIVGIVLAAGMSRRMGRNKLLLPLGGRPLLAHALGAMAASRVDEVVCVLGFEADAVRAALPEDGFPRPIRWVVNGAFDSGRASSIRAGVRSLTGDCEAAVFLPGDMPGVTSADVDAVVEAFRRTGAPAAVMTEGDGARSHPVLFRRDLFPRLCALEGDTGGQPLLEELWDDAAKVPRGAGRPCDVDTEEEYRRALMGEPWCAEGEGA